MLVRVAARPRVDFRFHRDNLSGFFRRLRSQLALLTFQRLAFSITLGKQIVELVLLGLSSFHRLLSGGSLRIGLPLERGDFILDGGKTLSAVLRRAQLSRSIVGGIAFSTGNRRIRLHFVDEILGCIGIHHHVHDFGRSRAVEAITRHLRDCSLRIIVISASLLDLLLKISLVLLGGFKSFLGSLSLRLRLLGRILSILQRLLCRRNLILIEIIELKNLSRQLGADTCQFGLEVTLALKLCLVLLHRNGLRLLRWRCKNRGACGDKSERCDQRARDGVDLFRALHITAFLVVYRTLYPTMLNGQWECPHYISPRVLPQGISEYRHGNTPSPVRRGETAYDTYRVAVPSLRHRTPPIL